MSKGDTNLKRLGLFIGILILLLFMYACQTVFMGDSAKYDELTDNANMLSSDESLSLMDYFNIISGFFLFIFGSLFLQLPNLAWYLNIILVPLYAILLFGFWGLIIDYIFDIADLIPFVG